MSVPCQWPQGECKIAFVGEAPGAEEVAHGKPFVGPAGRLFNEMLARSGIERSECLVTNVFDFKLPNNKIDSIAGPKSDETHEVPVDRGAYVSTELYKKQYNRVLTELGEAQPNIVVALGATAAWLLLDIAPFGALKKMRGTLHMGMNGFKVLVTYHPSYIQRSYGDMPLVLADLQKTKREAEFPELRPPEIEVFIPQWSYQVINFLEELGSPAAVDIETVRGRIDNIGFADRFEQSMSVPILDPNTLNWYWHTDYQRSRVLTAIANYLEGPKRKVFQNGSFDTQWLWERWGVKTCNWSDDTRLLHHSLWPELKKDLGTIASLHLTLPSWKMMGAGRKSDKKDD